MAGYRTWQAPATRCDAANTRSGSSAGEPSTTAAEDLATGEDPAGIFDASVDFLTGQGWTVTLEPIPGETSDYTMMEGSKRIVIDDDLAGAR